MNLDTLAPARPPGSAAEREAAAALAKELSHIGLETSTTPFRAPTSPTWAPLIRALLRVWGAALLAAGLPAASAFLAALALVGGIGWVAALLRFVPVLGGRSQNIVGLVRGRDPAAKPVVAVAHVDSHPTNGTPLGRGHRATTWASGWLLVVTSFGGMFRVVGWSAVAGPIAAEAIVTLLVLARGELRRMYISPDDNTSGLMGLARLAELTSHGSIDHDLWIVGTGAATSGNRGIIELLNGYRELKQGCVIELDALGSGELVASPFAARFPAAGTPPALVTSVQTAADRTGDRLAVRRMRRSHSDARAALRSRVPAITLTAGISHPARAGPDPANAARGARIVYELALGS